MHVDFTNAFDFQNLSKVKFKKFDFSFFDTYHFFDNYNYQKDNYNFYFSDLFFFNSLQVNDFMFLHRDFYQFYPVFKYMLMYDILMNKLSPAEIVYLRNCIVLSERADLFSIKQNTLNSDFLNASSFSKKITAQDFDLFYTNIHSYTFNSNSVKKFFFDFMDNQIFFQQVDEDFFIFSKKFYSGNLSPITEDQKLLFFYTISKGFNGILEMLHFYNKVRFPKRFIFLQNLTKTSNVKINADASF